MGVGLVNILKVLWVILRIKKKKKNDKGWWKRLYSVIWVFFILVLGYDYLNYF